MTQTASPSEAPPTLEIFVPGLPAPQGSKTGFAIKRGGAYTGKVAMIESSGNKLEKWRADVRADLRAEAERIGWETLTGPIRLDLRFYLPRPKGHYRTGKNAHLLKPSAPRYPVTVPDRDKLERGLVDALDSVSIIADDKLIIGGETWKFYAVPEVIGPGCGITITELEEQNSC